MPSKSIDSNELTRDCVYFIPATKDRSYKMDFPAVSVFHSVQYIFFWEDLSCLCSPFVSDPSLDENIA